MKCENCGKNEVTFVYHSNINGRVTERHLCRACAESKGYTADLFWDPRSGSRWGRSLFEELFLPSAVGAGRLTADVFDGFFAETPPHTPAREEQREELLTAEERLRIGKQRQLNAMRLELRESVRREDFERAARLRDEIRELEERKESA